MRSGHLYHRRSRSIPIRERGFTLIELLVVVVIVSTVSAIAVPVYLGQRSKANDAKMEQDLASISSLLTSAVSTKSPVTYSDSTIATTDSTDAGFQSVTVDGTISADFTSGSIPSGGQCVTVTRSDGAEGQACVSEAAGTAEQPDGGGGGGGAPAEPLEITYGASTFTVGSDSQALTPTVSGGVGTKSYSYSGSLPSDVTFSTTTGAFTGPAASNWPNAPTQVSSAQADIAYAAAATSGGTIVAGDFSQTATFGNLSRTSNGGLDIFVGKVSTAGVWEWVVTAGSTSSDSAYAVATASDGSAIVTGRFIGTVSFGSAGSISSAGGTDIFVAKVSSAGEWVWAARAGGSNGNSYEQGRGVSILPDGSAMITGDYVATPTFSPLPVPDPLSTTLPAATPTGNTDIFVARINSSGTWAWALAPTSVTSSQDFSGGISVLPDGTGAIAIGRFGGALNFGGTTVTSAGSTDIYVAKVNANGTWGWATRAGSSAAESGTAVSALTNGAAVISGSFAYGGSVTPPTFGTSGSSELASINGGWKGVNDILVARVNADGTWAWASSAGGTLGDVPNAIGALSDGSAVVVGEFRGSADFGSLSPLVSVASADVFVAKISSTGTWVWATAANGVTTGTSGNDIGRGVAVRPDGSSIVVGSFEGTLTFASGNTLTSSGSSDAFVARVSDGGSWTGSLPGVPSTLTVTVTDANGATASTPITLSIS